MEYVNVNRIKVEKWRNIPGHFAESDAGHGAGDVLRVEHTGVLQPFVEVLAGHFGGRRSAELRERLPSGILTFRSMHRNL